MKERMEVAWSRKGNDMRWSQRHMTINDSDFQQRDDWHWRLRVHRRNYFYRIRPPKNREYEWIHCFSGEDVAWFPLSWIRNGWIIFRRTFLMLNKPYFPSLFRHLCSFSKLILTFSSFIMLTPLFRSNDKNYQRIWEEITLMPPYSSASIETAGKSWEGRRTRGERGGEGWALWKIKSKEMTLKKVHVHIWWYLIWLQVTGVAMNAILAGRYIVGMYE